MDCALHPVVQPEYRMNGFNEFDVADRLRQRGWVRPLSLFVSVNAMLPLLMA